MRDGVAVRPRRYSFLQKHWPRRQWKKKNLRDHEKQANKCNRVYSHCRPFKQLLNRQNQQIIIRPRYLLNNQPKYQRCSYVAKRQPYGQTTAMQRCSQTSAMQPNVSHVAKRQPCSQTSAMQPNNSDVAMQLNISHVAKHQPYGQTTAMQRCGQTSAM